MSFSRFHLLVNALLGLTLLLVMPLPSMADAQNTQMRRYIVVLADSVNHPGTVAEDQAEETEGDLSFVYRHALKGYAAILPSDEVQTLEEDPRVKYVTPDRRVKTFAQTTPTGISRIKVPGNENLKIDSNDNLRVDADVAVIDTGIDYEHPDLDVVGRTDCVPFGEGEEAGECRDGEGTDVFSHGTHVAGTIAARDNGEGVVGVAPGARLWAVKVLTDEGWGYDSWIIAGIDWVTAHANQIEVANMSLGGAGEAPAMDEAIEASVQAGVVYAVAAGNEASDASEFSPASNPDVITVSAWADYDGKPGQKALPLVQPNCEEATEVKNAQLHYGVDDTLASFSNYGNDVEVTAPGVCVLSTVPGNSYAYSSGTSMASPHVAGAAAILASRDNPEDLKDVEEIRNTIVKEGEKRIIFEPILDLHNEAVFDPEPQVAVTRLATVNSATEITLHGELNPGGSSTEYWFEYGKTTSYGFKAPVPSAEGGSGAGFSSVEEAIGGLEGHTAYHYRLAANNVNGTSYGVDRIFATTPAVASTGGATEVSAHSATLNATVNPEGLPTTYRFEYGRTDSYGRQGPVTSAGDGSEAVEVSEAALDRFNSGITYHFRIRATNAGGITYGEDQTFTTPPPLEEWQAISSPNSEKGPHRRLQDVSCSSADDCMATGIGGRVGFWGEVEQAVSAHWDGEEWSDVPLPDLKEELDEEVYAASLSGSDFGDFGGENVGGISCSVSQWCVAVGTVAEQNGPSRFLLEQWDGSQWSVEKSVTELAPGGRLHDVSCVSASFCIAVGTRWDGDANMNVALSWDGEAWASMETVSPSAEYFDSTLDSISCTSTTSCLAVGRVMKLFPGNAVRSYGMAERWDGEEWVNVPVPNPEVPGDPWSGMLTQLHDVSCTGTEPASTRCLATNKHFVWRWDGSDLVSLGMGPGPVEGQALEMRDVSCATATACTVGGVQCTQVPNEHNCVGDPLRPFAASWDGSDWVSQTTSAPSLPEGNGSNFESVSCPSKGYCVATGYDWGKEEKTLAEHFATATASPPGATFDFAFGEAGTGNGQLSNPASAAIDASGDIWVTDSYNNRVEKFDSSGKYLFQFGSTGSSDGQFNEPIGIALDASGNIWVVDAGNNRIEKFDSSGKYLGKFGSEGEGKGQFVWPYGLAIDASGNLWVSDAGSGRIEKFDSSGKYLSQFGSEGKGDGQLNEPTDLAFDPSGNLLVADSYNNRIEKFDSSGKYLSQFGGEGKGDGQLLSPHGIAIDPLGHIWVADTYDDRVEEFDAEGKYLSQFGSTGSGEGQMSYPSDVVVGPGGDLWVLDSGNSRVQRWIPNRPPTASTDAASKVGGAAATLNGTVEPNGLATSYYFEYGETTSYGSKAPVPSKSAGSGTSGVKVAQAIEGLKAGATYHFRVVAESEAGTSYGEDRTFVIASDKRFDFDFGSTGSGNGQLIFPHGVAVDSSGNVWVTDSGNDRVQKFNAKGEYVSQFGSTGSGNGQFSIPTGIAVDSSGNLWVSDCGNDRIEKFNANGEYLSQIGKSGTGNGQFDCPVGLAFASSSLLFVVDNGNNRVQKLKTNGEYVAQLGSKGTGNGQLESPQGVALTSNRIWVTDSGNDRVQGFNRTTLAYVEQFGSHGSGDGQFNVPSGITVDLGGRLWVADAQNNRVQRFDEEGKYLDQLGSLGSGAGYMETPKGIAATGNWGLFVVDTENDRIQHWIQVPDAPLASTEAATSVTSTTATLNAKVNPYGLATAYRFEYDTASYKVGEKGHGTSIPAPDASAGSGYEEVSVAEAISGLKPKTKYYFRVVATSSSGTTEAAQKTFTTP